MAFDREKIKLQAEKLAADGVFIGTSSWKYEGWLDQLYSRDRYVFQGKFAKKRFDQNCLSEYAEVFKTVCVDSAYYDFPRVDYLQKLSDAVPDDFRFGLKVTDIITLKKFPNVERWKHRAGKPNGNFLDADLFANAFLKPCELIRGKIGVLMFEFSRFWSADYEHGREFIGNLDGFLGKLPKGWPYATEMRNANWLRGEYFDCLARHEVTHVFNSWEAMPPVSEQITMPGSRTNPKLCAARFLLKPGRKYEEAVKIFKPYDRVKEPNEEARKAGKSLIREGKAAKGKRTTLVYVNNRLEGNAPETIASMIEPED